MLINSQNIQIKIAIASIFFLFIMKMLLKITVTILEKLSLKQTVAVFEIYNISRKNIINSNMLKCFVLFIPY